MVETGDFVTMEDLVMDTKMLRQHIKKMRNCNQPLVSVLIPTYNCAQYLRTAIDSVLAQEYNNIEIIVVDDGSTDNTKEVLKNYPSSLKYFYQENKGVAFAHNACLKQASGEYIAWLDADDYWLPGKLKTQIKYFEEHPDCQVVFAAYQNFIEESVCSEDISVQNELIYEKIFRHYLPSALIKKEVFDKYGGFLENLVVSEDREIVYRWRLFAVNIDHRINTVYYHRRLHGANITLTHNAATAMAMYDIIDVALVEYAAKSGISIDVIEEMKRDIHNKWLAQKLRSNVQKGRSN
jgi:glycosyltransferase involved in cell wall biosynthesis